MHYDTIEHAVNRTLTAEEKMLADEAHYFYVGHLRSDALTSASGPHGWTLPM